MLCELVIKLAALAASASVCASCAAVPDREIPVPDEPYISETDEAGEMLEAMTLHEKICQMFIVRPESITGVDTAVQAGEATKAALEKYPVGGIIYGADNLTGAEQAAAMIANTVSYSKIQPFISVDEEGGLVARAAQKLGTTKFEPMYRYRDGGAAKASEIYETIAGDIKQFGFNLDYAPVADVWTNPENTVIGERAFSDDPDEAAAMVGAAVAALQDNGVCAAVKHFPGHGNTQGDSHEGFVYSDRTLDELRACEFLPFKAGIDAGTDFVMAGHIIIPDIDSAPASLSHTLITDILKGELGFGGIVITDGMEMGAIADNYSSADAAVLAVKAGCDMILEPADFYEAADALTAAVESGGIGEERIDESVRKILECKLRRGIIN